MFRTEFGGPGVGFQSFSHVLDPWDDRPKNFVERDLFSILLETNRRSRYVGSPISIFKGFKSKVNIHDKVVKTVKDMYDWREDLINSE